MTEYMDYNEWLQKENKQLKLTQQELINEVRKYSCKYFDLQNENDQLKQRISKLFSENTRLQNDLFSEQLEQDETEDYINKLKEENERKDELIKALKASESNLWHNSRESEYENELLKQKNGDLQEIIEIKNNNLLFTEQEMNLYKRLNKLNDKLDNLNK